MPKNFKVKALSIAASVALLGGTAFLASGATGAYFSDTHSGNISGTVGNIHVTPFGGGGANGTDLAFSNLLPGVAQTVKLNYTNTGSDPQDVYIVFNNATALGALNDLGHYGEAHLSANGVALFDSANLKDTAGSCGAFSPTGCWPLKAQYLLTSNLPAGATGDVSFSFNYAGKLKGQAPAGAPAAAWNTYPAADGQAVVNPADGTGSGLPYQIVATQHGITPGN
ncbi:hypothetical protein [Lacisediminihabitans profunda]|uniref:Uncharacterized protein n=1 Tax=Lacisediminihabitans profunda TaxID=2594790 RepID=A0A5C8UL11_9MICO|nr:hypothetical protein [Lacisediminihabitans profunda]TXN28988.1 hypothetical protein FVP33_15850 [Lacisediminihabitans profunda]